MISCHISAWTIILIVVVMDLCQDQRECRVLASPRSFDPDPCPGTSKYLEVAYQCRPNEFRSRITCENEELQLRCSKSERIAVYSAMFGRSPRGGHDCPAQSAYDAECRAECALHTVMQTCHGRRRCNLWATEEVFGNPCHEQTSKYLSVVYTCVPKRILKEKVDENLFISTFCKNKNEGEDGTSPLTTSVPLVTPSTTLNITYSERTPGVPDFVSTTFIPEVAESSDDATDFISDWLGTWKFISENEEKFLLYVVISVLVGLVLLLLVIILRLVMRRHYHKTKAKLDISEPIANSTRAPEGTPLPQPETSLLLEDSVDNNNGIEMLSFQHSSSLHRPPPGSATLNRQVPVTSSLDRNGQFPRGGSPYYNNTFRTDSANRINNYYYT